MGACTIRRTSPGRVVSSPFRMTWRLPTTESGTIEMPVCTAGKKLPALNGATNPSRLRVPSGNTMSERPRDGSDVAHRKIPCRSGRRRSTSMCPERRRCQPRIGKRPSDALAMIRNWNGTEANSTGMS